jgi:hypothetical protein
MYLYSHNNPASPKSERCIGWAQSTGDPSGHPQEEGNRAQKTLQIFH